MESAVSNESSRWSTLGPLANLQRGRHRRLAEFVGERRILNPACQHHAANAERGERQRKLPCRFRGSRNPLLEGFDHHPQRRSLRHPDRLVGPGNVIGQADQWTVPLHFLEVLAGKIIADEVSGAIRCLLRGRNVFQLAACKPADRLGIEFALAPEVAVEAAARHSGACHDVVDRGGGEPMPVEEKQRALNDPLPDLFTVVRLTDHSHARAAVE